MLGTKSLPKYFVGVVISLLVGIVAHYKLSFQYWKRKNVPYLKPRIPFGNLVNPLNRTVSMRMNMWELYKAIRKNKWKHGGIFFMSKPVYYVTDLDYIRSILTDNYQYFVDCLLYNNEKDDVYSVHCFATLRTMKKLKTTLTPPLSFKKMKILFQTVMDSKNDLLERIEQGCVFKPVIVIKEVFMTGFESCSKIVTFALFELAKHQDIQKKLRRKIRSILAKYEDKITYQALVEMKYMDRIIDETLRKHPPVSFLTRKCVKDYKIPDDDVIIEKGATVVVPIYGLHHDEEYFPEAEEFDPKRFTERNKSLRHRYAFIPFGEDPRMCGGMRFVLMQSKVALIALLKNFNYSLNVKTQDEPLEIMPESFLLVAENGEIWLDANKVQRKVDEEMNYEHSSNFYNS